jgi:predicted AAA+ superfamily ATPase
MIKREKYLRRIGPFIDKPLIKAITGIRRCGKSTFLNLLMNELSGRGVSRKNIVYINKDSLEFDQIITYSELNDFVKTRFKGIRGKKYLFIDEVQEIQEWEKAAVSFLTNKTADIYITGSNAGLLSSDLASLLTGRYIEIKINTLAFAEFLKFRKKTSKDKEEEFRLFLKYGGFPGVHQMELNDEVISQYINSIYSTILLKDVVSRNQVRDVALLERIVRYITDNTGNITTAKGISNYIKSQHLSCSVDTVQSYIRWLTDAYLVFKASRFDIRGKRILELYEKYYPGDPGLIFSIHGNRPEDIAAKLENVVYLELLSRNYSVFTGKLYDLEVDFIAVRGNQKIYLQVTYLLHDKKVIEREFSSLAAIRDNFPKIVLSLDNFYEGGRDGIKWINLIDFLLTDDTV